MKTEKHRCQATLFTKNGQNGSLIIASVRYQPQRTDHTLVHGGFHSVLATHRLLTILCTDSRPSVSKIAWQLRHRTTFLGLCFRYKKTCRDLHVDSFGRFASWAPPEFFAGGGKSRGAEWRAPKARGRGAAGAEGVRCENFSIFELKKASFDAFWVLFFEVELNGTFFTLK